MLLALDNLPPAAQWGGFVATLAGAWLAWWAWWRAKGAREQARLATEAAVRLGRGAQLRDLQASLQEVQSLLARGDLPATGDKCALLQGRIAGFREEAYNELSVEGRKNLTRAVRQLEIIADVATAPRRMRKADRIAQIQTAYRQVEIALNRAAGEHRRDS